MMAATGVTDGPKLFQGVARNDFAFKLLKQMGWEEGMGLGKEKQGIKTHIRVKKNVEQSGVGLAEARKVAADWTINTSIYDRILANLKVKSAGERKEENNENDKKEKKRKKKKEDVGAEEDSDSEREGLEKESTKKRKVSKEEPVEQPRKLARHVGRYKKREASKSVAGYASHHLQEILGGQPSPRSEEATPTLIETRITTTEETETVLLKKKKKPKSSKESTPVEDTSVSVTTTREVTSTSGATQSTTAVATAVTVEATGVGASLGEAVKSLAADPNWWGHKYGFVKGGALGEKRLKKDAADEAKQGFLEQDQEDLYNLVQDNKTSGKQGLGIRSQPKKVAGARWKGSKVNFDAESEDSEEETAAANENLPRGTSYNDVLERVRGARDEDLTGNGNILSIEDKTRRADEKDEEFRNGGQDLAAGEGEAKKIKWNKLLQKELEQLPLKGMKMSKLRKRLVAAALAKAGAGGLEKAEAKRIAEEKIRTSSKCMLDGERVFPATGIALPLKHRA